MEGCETAMKMRQDGEIKKTGVGTQSPSKCMKIQYKSHKFTPTWISDLVSFNDVQILGE